jgi:hypothetical protein
VLKKAFELSPANAENLVLFAQVLHAAGKFEESL